MVAQMVKNLPAMQKTWVRSLSWEDPLEKGMATHSSVLAWRTPWTEEPGVNKGQILKTIYLRPQQPFINFIKKNYLRKRFPIMKTARENDVDKPYVIEETQTTRG